MRTLPIFSLIALPACLAPWGGPPSDDLNQSWKEDIAADHVPTGEGSEFNGAPVEDPSGIEGTFNILDQETDCVVRYDMEGDPVECSGCDYAFDVELLLSLDSCGVSGDEARSARAEFSRDRFYLDGTYIAAFTVDGAFVDWYGSGYTTYYDYYDYYDGGYDDTIYYGSALLLR